MANKLSKKEIEEPDRFLTFVNEALAYFKMHQMKFYIGLGILVLVVGASLGWYFYDRSVENDAQKVYSQALNLSAQINRQADKMGFAAGSAIAAQYYEELIKKYPGTHAARIAHYDLGSIYLRTGQIDKAISKFDSYIRNSSRGDELVNYAYSGLGYCYEAKKDYPKALEMMKKSLEGKEGSAFAGMTYNVIGGIYEKQGNKSEALKSYRKALEQKNEPMVEALIKKKIAELS